MLYHRGDLPGSERYLRKFISTDPEGPRADDAQYWIGEGRFAGGDYREAIREYEVLVDRYAVSDRVAIALYKIALCHERLGEEVEMRRTLRSVGT